MSWTSGLGALSTAGLPGAGAAQLPASIRNGSPAAKSAYETGLGFEDMLVNQLAQEMMATAGGSDPTASDGGSGGGSNPTSGPYSALLAQALTSGIMSAGGLGIAQQIAGALDPSLGTAATPANPATAATPASPSTGGAGL